MLRQLRTFLLASERPRQAESPWPWGALWIFPDGTAQYQDDLVTENYANLLLDTWLQNQRRRTTDGSI